MSDQYLMRVNATDRNKNVYFRSVRELARVESCCTKCGSRALTPRDTCIIAFYVCMYVSPSLFSQHSLSSALCLSFTFSICFFRVLFLCFFMTFFLFCVFNYFFLSSFILCLFLFFSFCISLYIFYLAIFYFSFFLFSSCLLSFLPNKCACVTLTD